MAFRISGLSPEPFRHLFHLPDDALAACGAKRYIVDREHAFPDRIELRDLEPGESAILLNHTHQPANNVYRASHAIFVREGAEAAFDAVDEVPEAMRIRPLSLRAFDAEDMMVDADLADGREAEALIERLFEHPQVSYIHAHYARRGCYAARIDRG